MFQVSGQKIEIQQDIIFKIFNTVFDRILTSESAFVKALHKKLGLECVRIMVPKVEET